MMEELRVMGRNHSACSKIIVIQEDMKVSVGSL